MLRAFSTQTATFVDGIRDLGAITRDVFNIEQVEVVKGPAGAEYRPRCGVRLHQPDLQGADPGRRVRRQRHLNSADHKRVTADVNKKIGATAAFRLNAMAQGGGVAGRDHIENNGFGIAPSWSSVSARRPASISTPSTFAGQRPRRRDSTIGMEGFFNANAAIRNGAKVDRDNYSAARTTTKRSMPTW